MTEPNEEVVPTPDNEPKQLDLPFEDDAVEEVVEEDDDDSDFEDDDDDLPNELPVIEDEEDDEAKDTD